MDSETPSRRQSGKIVDIWPFRLGFPVRRGHPTEDQWMILALGIPALVLPFFLRPGTVLAGTHTQLPLPPCPFYLVTSIPCPVCGMTTSFALLVRGLLIRSFLAHPLGAAAYLYLAGLTATAAATVLARRPVTVAVRATLAQTVLVLGTAWAVKLAVWFALAPGI